MGLLQSCRVFVFPSTVEAMSMMLLEALAVGTVGIASDIPENTSILPEGYPDVRGRRPRRLAPAARARSGVG